MTKEELKRISLSDLSKMFGSRCKNNLSFYKYPLLVNNIEKNCYELKDYIIEYPKFKYLLQYPQRYNRYIDNLFNKYNAVELLTDADDTMKEFSEFDYIVDLPKLKKKYNELTQR